MCHVCHVRHVTCGVTCVELSLLLQTPSIARWPLRFLSQLPSYSRSSSSQLSCASGTRGTPPHPRQDRPLACWNSRRSPCRSQSPLRSRTSLPRTQPTTRPSTWTSRGQHWRGSLVESYHQGTTLIWRRFQTSRQSIHVTLAHSSLTKPRERISTDPHPCRDNATHQLSPLTPTHHPPPRKRQSTSVARTGLGHVVLREIRCVQDVFKK